MSDRNTVISFTKDILDRIRDYSKKIDPAGWKEIEELPLRDESGIREQSFHEKMRERERDVRLKRKDK